jgi:hypothetical protein
MVSWALHPERPRDAEYRMEELAKGWAEYQRLIGKTDQG